MGVRLTTMLARVKAVGERGPEPGCALVAGQLMDHPRWPGANWLRRTEKRICVCWRGYASDGLVLLTLRALAMRRPARESSGAMEFTRPLC